jgi:hypothetical protein
MRTYLEVIGSGGDRSPRAHSEIGVERQVSPEKTLSSLIRNDVADLAVGWWFNALTARRESTVIARRTPAASIGKLV